MSRSAATSTSRVTSRASYVVTTRSTPATGAPTSAVRPERVAPVSIPTTTMKATPIATATDAATYLRV